jgi:hypothetical protein
MNSNAKLSTINSAGVKYTVSKPAKSEGTQRRKLTSKIYQAAIPDVVVENAVGKVLPLVSRSSSCEPSSLPSILRS